MKVIGIDLGTTNTVVAGIKDGEPVVVPSALGTPTTPSIVAYIEGKVLTGHLAKRQAVINPTRTITAIKRIVGRRYEEVTGELTVPYQIVEGPNGFAAVKIGEQVLLPEAIIASILKAVKRNAEKYFGQEVSEAVITIPAYFNDNQRTATRNAGEAAELKVNMTIHEPTAAAVAYGFGKKVEPETILVLDLGGGTFDVSILATGATNQVLGTSGDSHLGGNDWDDLLVAWLISRIKETGGIDPSENLQALIAIREQAELVKVALSTAESFEVKLPFIGSKKSGRQSVPVHFTGTLAREQFEAMCTELLSRLRHPFEQALKNASLKTESIDAVILVGGATNMPMVQRLARDLSGKEPRTVARLEEIVARGAAIQAGASARELVAPVLLDITPLSLGVRRGKEGMDVIIPLGTRIPATLTRTYTTTVNGQTAVDIEVWQGERRLVNQNHFLGKFSLTGIPPAPKGHPKIEVTFGVDASGILSVSAIDTESGRNRAITVTGTSLPPETIRRMLAEAEANAETDRQRLEAEQAKEALRPLVAEAEEAVNKLEGKERQDFELVFETGRKAIESNNPEQVRSTTDLLKTALDGAKATA